MGMTCHEFNERWNDRLDLRASAGPETDEALSAHAASCPSCRDRAAGYETLRRAFGSWGATPPSSLALTDRILDARAAEIAAPRATIRLAAFGWAAAAALLLAAGLGLYRLAGPPATPNAPTLAQPTPTLSGSLASATAATLDLARETSAPAARIGRLVLASAGTLETDAADAATSSDPAASSSFTVFGSVGSGLRPLSGSARSAFGFLLGPAASAPGHAPTTHPDA